MTCEDDICAHSFELLFLAFAVENPYCVVERISQVLHTRRGIASKE